MDKSQGNNLIYLDYKKTAVMIIPQKTFNSETYPSGNFELGIIKDLGTFTTFPSFSGVFYSPNSIVHQCSLKLLWRWFYEISSYFDYKADILEVQLSRE